MEPHAKQPAPRPQATDSPWFWVTLFSSAALVILVIAEGQVDRRQVRIERQTQGRARALEMAADGEATTEMSTLGDTEITTTPLIVLLAIVLLISGNMFWLWRWKQRKAVEETVDSIEAARRKPSGAS